MIGIIVQARMSSTRLPGKVLLPINGVPMLEIQLKRLTQTKVVDKVVVATSNEALDSPIETLCQKLNIECYRGDLNDVLARFYHCAKAFNFSHIIRICGDCPLIDPELIDQIVSTHITNNTDYTSNCVTRCFPDGQDVEVFSFNTLETAYEKAKKPSEREHVTPFIRESNLFSLEDFTIDQDYSEFRISVDHPQDFEVISAIYRHFDGQQFGYQQIVEYLQSHPQVNALNADIELNEGYKLSLLQDKEQGF